MERLHKLVGVYQFHYNIILISFKNQSTNYKKVTHLN